MKKDLFFVKKIGIVFAAFILVFSVLALIACERTPEKKTAEQLFKDISPSVCVVRSDYSEGSGFVIEVENSTIYILTNKHIFEKNGLISPSARVEFLSGKKYEAKLLGYNGYHDIALLRVETTDAVSYTPLQFAQDNPNTGAKLYSIGNALQLGLGMFEGIVSNPQQILELDNKRVPVIQVTVPINAGCSGGPVFDEYGFVVGVGTYQMPQKDDRLVDGVSFCVSTKIADKIIRQIKNENADGAGDAVECFLLKTEYTLSVGINKFEINFTALNFSAAPTDGGFIVTHASNLATDAGMQLSVGDKITRIGSLELATASVSDIFAEIYSYTDTRIDTNIKTDKLLKIAYENNGIKKELTVLNKNEKNY